MEFVLQVRKKMASPLEIIAVLFAVLVIVKLVFIVVNKQLFYKNVVKPLYSSKINGGVFGILAVVVFYYLIQELTIVQIFGAMVFTSLLMGATLARFSKDLLKLADKVYKKKFDSWMWIYALIWVVLSLLVLYEVFM